MTFATLATRIFLLLTLTIATGRAAVSDTRFSATLTPAQRAELGFTQLTDDNIAVIDGLVRQDEAASKFKHNAVDGTRFSQRRTAHERDLAGLDRLTAAQLAWLDELVVRQIYGPVLSAASSSGSSPGPAEKTVAPKLPLEIHGQISYTYGWGKGGNVQGGDIMLYYDDPDHRYSVLVAYSEYHGKGLFPGYYPGYFPCRRGSFLMLR